ncbi:MAG: hypothetical protein AMJ73_06480 [candidate division Zixibacteria bacterium SM1_73]|nr:MAG: hypothetical protein AMJ73_06480 [candidate division Zixibacteria bacterium SM1_73]
MTFVREYSLEYGAQIQWIISKIVIYFKLSLRGAKRRSNLVNFNYLKIASYPRQRRETRNDELLQHLPGNDVLTKRFLK